MSEYIYVDYSVEPNELLCERCGAREKLPKSPFRNSVFMKQSEAFAKKHKNCSPLEEYEVEQG